MRHGSEPKHHLPSCGMENVMVFMPGVPGFPPGASWSTRERHKKPPAEAGGLRVTRLPVHHAPRFRTEASPAVVRHGKRDGFYARCPRISTRGFWFHTPRPQKAPGGSRGTPGHLPSRSPCATVPNRSITFRRAAWNTGWFSSPVSPGFHPGLLGAQKAPGGSRGTPGGQVFPGAMRFRFEPGQCVR